MATAEFVEKTLERLDEIPSAVGANDLNLDLRGAMRVSIMSLLHLSKRIILKRGKSAIHRIA